MDDQTDNYEDVVEGVVDCKVAWKVQVPWGFYFVKL